MSGLRHDGVEDTADYTAMWRQACAQHQDWKHRKCPAFTFEDLEFPRQIVSEIAFRPSVVGNASATRGRGGGGGMMGGRERGEAGLLRHPGPLAMSVPYLARP